MIHVIATIELNPGDRDKYLEILRENIPHVRAEQGCIHYEPAVDIETDITLQEKTGPDVVTLIEAWEDVAALKRHFTQPHMLSYREKAKDLIRQVRIRVLQPA